MSQPVLRQGNRGDAVAELQQALTDAGFDAGGVDGIFGPGTKVALEGFQAANGLTADGIAGPQTWAALGGSGGTGQPTTPTTSSETGGSEDKPMSEKQRAELVAAAKKQGFGGSAALTAQMESALPAGKTLDDWFSEHMPDATFLGLRIRASDGSTPGVHKGLLNRLQLAEAALRGKFPGLDDGAIRTNLGIRDIGGLRRPKLASGGSTPSMHCFGMAIDINPSTNPFVGLKKVSNKVKDPAERKRFEMNRSPEVIKRAMLMIHGRDFDIETKLGGSPDAVWELHDEASRALASYLQLAEESEFELHAAVERARAAGDNHDLTWWKKRIADDKQYLPYWDFAKHPAPEKTGYMDLPKDFVLALVNEGGLTWGGQYRAAKDMMHFDYRSSIQRG